MGNLCCGGQKREKENRDIEEKRSIDEEDDPWNRVIDEERALTEKQPDKEIEALRNNFDIDTFNALFKKRGHMGAMWNEPMRRY